MEIVFDSSASSAVPLCTQLPIEIELTLAAVLLLLHSFQQRRQGEDIEKKNPFLSFAFFFLFPLNLYCEARRYRNWSGRQYKEKGARPRESNIKRKTKLCPF